MGLNKLVYEKKFAGRGRGNKGIVTGHKEVDAILAAFAPNTQRRILRGASRKSAKMVAQRARAYVPVDTGELRKSIKVRALKKSRTRVGTQIVGGAGGKGPAYYGRFVELGTKSKPARPFLRRALYDMEDAIRANFAQDVRDEISSLEAKGKILR